MKSASLARLLNADVLVRAFAIFAGAGFAASAAIHLASFFGISPFGTPLLLPVMHVGVFVAFFPALLLSGSRSSKPNPDAIEKEKAMERLLAAVPKWLKTTVVVVGVYAFVNALIFMFYLSEGGVTGEIDGKLVIHSHGRVIRELTPEEFDRHQAYHARGVSGHWMAFYAISFALLTGASRVGAAPDQKRSGFAAVAGTNSTPSHRTASSSAGENAGSGFPSAPNPCS